MGSMGTLPSHENYQLLQVRGILYILVINLEMQRNVLCEITHPIMTGKHEVIGSLSSIPEGVFARYHSHIISHKLFHCSVIVGERLIEILDHPCDTERHKVNMSSSRIPCFKPLGSVLHLVYEPPLYCVYVFAWPVVDNW